MAKRCLLERAFTATLVSAIAASLAARAREGAAPYCAEQTSRIVCGER
jgi:hypothetical protein